MEINRLLLSPAGYYTSDMPVTLTAWLCVKMYTLVEHDFRMTCYERPPVLRDRFCLAEGVVAQDRFYCISNQLLGIPLVLKLHSLLLENHKDHYGMQQIKPNLRAPQQEFLKNKNNTLLYKTTVPNKQKFCKKVAYLFVVDL